MKSKENSWVRIPQVPFLSKSIINEFRSISFFFNKFYYFWIDVLNRVFTPNVIEMGIVVDIKNRMIWGVEITSQFTKTFIWHTYIRGSPKQVAMKRQRRKCWECVFRRFFTTVLLDILSSSVIKFCQFFSFVDLHPVNDIVNGTSSRLLW